MAIISFLTGFLLGFFMGLFFGFFWLNQRFPLKNINSQTIFNQNRLKVLSKKEPIPAEQENIENIEQEKPAIKTFYKI